MRYPHSVPQITDDEVEAAARVLRSGQLVAGPEVEGFEEEFAAYLGVEHVVAVNSGTAALVGALRAIGVQQGDAVAVPALSFAATATAVMELGAEPLFVDVNAIGGMDPVGLHGWLDEELHPKRNGVAAVIPVHLYGHPCDMEAIEDVARARIVPVVEDAAQAHGAQVGAHKVGSLGLFGCFSFMATKNMTCGTEGGAIATNDGVRADFLRQWRNHGMSDRHTHEILGGNYRMSEVAGAIARVQLRKLDAYNEGRRALTAVLVEGLQDVPWLEPLMPLKHTISAQFWAPFRVDEAALGLDTQWLVDELAQREVGVRYRYLRPLYKQPAIKARLSDAYWLPGAERLAGCVIGLPNHPGMQLEDAAAIVDIVKEIKP